VRDDAPVHLCCGLYTCAVPVQPDDLTASARIREAALELFAANGVAGTSLRSVAARAHVSPSLVVHHFRTKAGLRQAVDDAVLTTFRNALHSIDIAGTPEQVSDQLNVAISAIIGGDVAVREYLGRSLFEGTESSQRLFDTLVDLVADGLAQLERAGVVRRGSDPVWRAYAVLFMILGPVMLSRPLGKRLGVDAFAPEVVARRSTSNVDLLRHGLFRTDGA
jgi:TetR/AcrR family transcriptional regulator, regulator of cefoperazone and chloramphenicol sensitivity